jgi:hypothetical protein
MMIDTISRLGYILTVEVRAERPWLTGGAGNVASRILNQHRLSNELGRSRLLGMIFPSGVHGLAMLAVALSVGAVVVSSAKAQSEYWTLIVKVKPGGGFGEAWQTKFFGPYPSHGECMIAATKIDQQYQDAARASGHDSALVLPQCIMRERQPVPPAQASALSAIPVCPATRAQPGTPEWKPLLPSVALKYVYQASRWPTVP